jgi:uncharacterized NAD-dependent epimerase/dehydratase family protein
VVSCCSSRARARSPSGLPGVTLGLIHGSAPHVFVLCHKAGATEVEGYPGYPLPSLPELVELHERIALPLRPAELPASRSTRPS